MRKNLPVVNTEIAFPKGKTLGSKTDLKGRITYANDVFVEMSGFTHEELLGQPHSLVRHPDMPAEAFSDLWSTLKSGFPWRVAWSRTAAKMAGAIGWRHSLYI